MIGETQRLLLLDFLDRLLKSWWTVVAGVCVGASLGVVGLHFTVPVYEATATIEADVEKLPSEFIRRTISDDVSLQLEDLRNAVLSEKNLKTVISSVFGTPRSESHGQAVAEWIASNVTMQFSTRTRTIFVRYRNRVPETAAEVTNILADFFVVENKGLRAESARQVRESMESLATEVSSELETGKRALNELLMNHPQELESQRGSHERTIERLEEDLEKNEETIRADKRRLSVLETQYARRRIGDSGDERPSDEGQKMDGGDPRIAELEREIAELLTKRTENHPDVVAKRRQLEQRRAAIENMGGAASAPQNRGEEQGSRAPLPALDIWETRIQAARLAVERLEDRSRAIRREVARYRGYLANMPKTQQMVDDLTTRVSVLQQTHLEQQEKIETARTGQKWEEKDIANPFVVTQYAAPPAAPVWPNRLMFLVVGVAAGLLVFTGPVLAYAFLKPAISSEAGLSQLADVPVLVAIPIIPTPAVARLRRRASLRNFGLSALAVVILAGVAAMKYVDLI